MPWRMRGSEILDRLTRTGRSRSALGRHLGKDIHYVRRLIEKPELTPSLAAQIEDFFADEVAPLEPATIRVPVFGYAAEGGDERISLANDHVLDEIEIPLGLIRGDAFGVRVSGDSMEPRLFSGETVIVARKVAPARFGDCVVEFRDGTALVKQYRGQRDGKVFLYQFNPEREFPVEGALVKSIHAVAYRR